MLISNLHLSNPFEKELANLFCQYSATVLYALMFVNLAGQSSCTICSQYKLIFQVVPQAIFLFFLSLQAQLLAYLYSFDVKIYKYGEKTQNLCFV